MGQAGPSDLGRGEVGAAAWRAYLLAKQSCTVQEAAGRCKERDGGARMLKGTREAVVVSKRKCGRLHNQPSCHQND